MSAHTRKHGRNLRHNVSEGLQVVSPDTRHLSPVTSHPWSLVALAERYFRTQVAGQAAGTIDAKQRDLGCFVNFYIALYGHDDGREWYKSVTELFVKELVRGNVLRPSKKQAHERAPQRLSQSTIVRTYATIRHFARWIHYQVMLFPNGCPTDNVRAPEEAEPDWKGLTHVDQIRLLAAAQTLRLRPGHGTDQGLRDHALVATLLGTGLRIAELLRLERAQYNGKAFTQVLRKGGAVQKSVPVQKVHREVLDQWLAERGDYAGALFTTRTGKALTRQQAFDIVKRMERHANAQLAEEEKLKVSPHVLRHTLLRKVANEKGVHYAMEMAGHKSDRYIWRYVKPDAQSLADALDELE